MNGSQRAVLWIGLILVAANLVMKWAEIKAVIFSGASGVLPSSGGSTSGGSGGNSVQVPIDPFLPTGPKINVPLPHILLA